MGIFSIFKRKKKKAELSINDFIIKMYDRLFEKSNEGEKLDNLNEKERVIYICQEFEAEVNNGGFDQYLYNSSGNNANDIVDALKEIKAFKTAKLCEKVLDYLGGSVPRDHAERIEYVDKYEDEGNFEEFFAECDDKFYAYDDNLNMLCYEYIMKNIDSFTDDEGGVND